MVTMFMRKEKSTEIAVLKWICLWKENFCKLTFVTGTGCLLNTRSSFRSVQLNQMGFCRRIFSYFCRQNIKENSSNVPHYTNVVLRTKTSDKSTITAEGISFNVNTISFW